GSVLIALAAAGLLLARSAWEKAMIALAELAPAAFAWRSIERLYRAGLREKKRGQSASVPVDPKDQAAKNDRESDASSAPLLEASNLAYRYPEARAPALRGCDLVVGRGDRVLVEGPSGGGKSTLVAALAGLTAPDQGSLRFVGRSLEEWGE